MEFTGRRYQGKGRDFKSQDDLKRLQDKRINDYEAARRLVETAVNDLIPAKGQFVVIKPWHSNFLRLGIMENIRLPGKRQSFSLDLLELKQELKPSKVKINLSSKSEIYAILQPEELPVSLSKLALITMIEQGDEFRGLLWRRPQELW